MTIEIPKGFSIYQAAELACNHAKIRMDTCEFEFSGIKLHATMNSFSDDIARIYMYICKLRRKEDFIASQVY